MHLIIRSEKDVSAFHPNSLNIFLGLAILTLGSPSLKKVFIDRNIFFPI